MVVLTLVNLVNYMDRYVVPGVGESLQHSELHLTDSQFGALTSAFFLVYMCAAPVLGAYGHRRWRLRLVAGGIAVWSVATALAGLAHSYPALLSARASVGIGEAAYSAIAPALLADAFPARLRGRVFSVFFCATPVGSALGYVFGGVVDQHYGWRAAFLLAGVPGLLLAVLVLTLTDPARGTAGPGAAPGAGSAVHHVPEPGRGQRANSRREAGLDRRVVEVERRAAVVADQPRPAVGCHQQRVGQPGLVGHRGGHEHRAQPGRPGTQRGGLRRRGQGVVHLAAMQLGREGRRLGGRVVDQPHGDVRARHRVSVELHKTITADCRRVAGGNDRGERTRAT